MCIVLHAVVMVLLLVADWSVGLAFVGNVSRRTTRRRELTQMRGVLCAWPTDVTCAAAWSLATYRHELPGVRGDGVVALKHPHIRAAGAGVGGSWTQHEAART